MPRLQRLQPPSVVVRVGVPLVVLPEQVLAIVVAVRRPHDRVDVLPGRRPAAWQVRERDRTLMVGPHLG